MTFNLSTPSIIIENQFISVDSQHNMHNLWYVAEEGIDFFRNNVGLLSSINVQTSDLLELALKQYKSTFEFVFEHNHLAFFRDWTTLELSMYDDKKRDHSTNVRRFLSMLNLEYSFNTEEQTYSIKDLPYITNQYDMYCFINEHISTQFNVLFQPEHVAHCSLNRDEFSMFQKIENKFDFLENFRFKKRLEDKMPQKNINSFRKI